MDINTGSSQNFFVLCATIAMAVFASARGIESLRAFSSTTEDFLHMRTLAIQAGIAAICSMLPLALSGVLSGIAISSYALFGLTSAAYVRFVYQIARKKIVIRYKAITLTLLVAAALGLAAVLMNAINIQSAELYKGAMLLFLAILCVRFYLIVGLVLKPRELDH